MEYKFATEQGKTYKPGSFAPDSNGVKLQEPSSREFQIPSIVWDTPGTPDDPASAIVQFGDVRLTFVCRGSRATLYTNKGGPVGVWDLAGGRIDGSEETCAKLGRGS